MTKKLRIILDCKGPKGGFLPSGRIITLSDKVADELIAKKKAVIFKPKKFVKISNGQKIIKEISWGEYLKRNRQEKKKIEEIS